MTQVFSQGPFQDAAKRLGTFLRRLRLDRGWTQSQAGEYIGVDAITVRRWELGTFSPSRDSIGKIAQAYGVRASEIVTAASTGGPGSDPALYPLIGSIEAGIRPEREATESSWGPVPATMVRQHPDALALQVSGNYLSIDGIHDGDVLVVDPGEECQVGCLCVARIRESFCAASFISDDHIRIRTATGHVEDLRSSDYELLGRVVWHVRRLGGPRPDPV